jgi:hypothetical protein
MASEELWTSSGETEEEESVDLVLGVHQASSLQELLRFLPPRPEVDRTLSLYFSAKWLIFRWFSPFHLKLVSYADASSNHSYWLLSKRGKFLLQILFHD